MIKTTYRRTTNESWGNPLTYSTTIDGVEYRIKKIVDRGSMYSYRGEASYEAYLGDALLAATHTLAQAKEAVAAQAAIYAQEEMAFGPMTASLVGAARAAYRALPASDRRTFATFAADYRQAQRLGPAPAES